MANQPGARSPHKYFYHYDGRNRLVAVRSGSWKLMFPQSYNSPERGQGGLPGKRRTLKIELSLFNLEQDVGETRNVAAENPGIVEQMLEAARLMRQDLGDGPDDKGTGRRPIGT